MAQYAAYRSKKDGKTHDKRLRRNACLTYFDKTDGHLRGDIFTPYPQTPLTNVNLLHVRAQG